MGKDIFLYIFSVFIIACVAGVIAVLIFFPVPKENHDAFMQSTGAIITWGGGVVGYWIGSSKGSSEKTQLLNTKP
jgi:hypothetical protein